jgi:hypothetical protein
MNERELETATLTDVIDHRKVVIAAGVIWTTGVKHVKGAS